ncbi:MAG TPA: Wzz/FepE/Etk N-terminal domain-containing protein, partial [Candidatus Omnitrophota bacterium]|nr:Wzz/FepE/Etk N-terminal domain-containing protein [Candidatus Omnitrophota bacterium]
MTGNPDKEYPPIGQAPPPTDLKHVLRIVSRRRWTFAIALLAVIAAAFLAAFGIHPRYAAEATVLLESRKTQVSTQTSVLSDLPADMAAVRSEIEIIRSNQLLATVVDRLGLANDPEFTAPRWHDRVLAQAVALAPALAPMLGDQSPAHRRQELFERVQDRLIVTNDSRSYSLRIKFVSEDAAKAARIANAFATAYVEAQMQIRGE